MIATLNELCNFLPYLYFGMFLVCIGIAKKQTSLSITIILMSCAEFIMDAAAPHLFNFAMDRSIEYEVRVGIWMLFWSYCFMFFALILQKSHDWLNLVKKRAVYIVQALLAALAGVEWITFTNTVFLKTVFIKQMYTAAVPVLGLVIFVYLFIELSLSIKEKYAEHLALSGRGI